MIQWFNDLMIQRSKDLKTQRSKDSSIGVFKCLPWFKKLKYPITQGLKVAKRLKKD